MSNASVIPASVTAAGVRRPARVEWLRVRPWQRLTDSGFAPSREHLHLLAVAGEFVAVIAAVLLFILA